MVPFLYFFLAQPALSGTEILAANPIIPETASTLPPDLPMKIPIYYLPFWGSAYQIIPDSLFVNGPLQRDFDTAEFVAQQAGWLNGYSSYASGTNRTGAELVDLVATNFSISPRLLLALLEYQAGALSEPAVNAQKIRYPLGNPDPRHRGLFLQLTWAANLLNNSYYSWRNGTLTSFDLPDDRLVRPDPWQNAATVALQHYFAQVRPLQEYELATSPEGFARAYTHWFGAPWEADEPHIPGSLQQPVFSLPFEPRKAWAYTSGPHSGWGEGPPLAALDFAPPAVRTGCQESDEWVTAVAPGVVTRSETGVVLLDLDLDGDERTGWVVFYFHVGTEGRVPQGTSLDTGQRIGHPSCEGGQTTGTHVHIARKDNGEWVPADGAIPFNLGEWIAKAGSQPRLGSLTRYSDVVTACTCSNQASHIQIEEQ